MEQMVEWIFGKEAAEDKDIMHLYNEVYKDAVLEYAKKYHEDKLNNLSLQPVIHWQRFTIEKPIIGRNIIVKRTDLKYIPEVIWCEPVMMANLEIYKDTVEWAYV